MLPAVGDVCYPFAFLSATGRIPASITGVRRSLAL
jgi:hypothetical protein